MKHHKDKSILTQLLSDQLHTEFPMKKGYNQDKYHA